MLANIPVANSIRGNPVYNLRDVGPALFGSPASADPDDIHDPSKMSPKDRKDWFQSENERVKLEVSARQLVHGDEVREQLSCIVKAVTEVLDTWPDKLERDKGRSVAQINEAQSMVDELRDTRADEVKEIMPADASAHLYRIQNLSKTETLWFNDTGAEAAADTPGSYALAPGEYYEFSSTHAVSVYATTAIAFSAARY